MPLICSGWSGIADGERRVARVPAPAARRDAPARDDRDGPRAAAAPAHRGRADDRARRDDPGAGHRPHPRPHPPERDRGADHHPRPGRGRRHDPADVRDVRGVRGRDRHHARAVRAAAPPVHGRPAQLDLPDRRGEPVASCVRSRASPPEQTRPPVGCPFAPRCAWRLPVCWTDMPPLVPAGTAATQARLAGAPLPQLIRSGPMATHRFACHNPPTDEEAAAGRPLRPGFVGRRRDRPVTAPTCDPVRTRPRRPWRTDA